MENDSAYYTNLISRYFFGEATPGELLELEEWVKADQANAREFSAFQKTWKTIEHARIGSSLDLDQEWNNLSSRLKREETSLNNTTPQLKNPKSEIRNLKSEIFGWSLRIAALMLVLLVPAFLVYRSLTTPETLVYAASGEIKDYTLPDGTRVTLNSGATLTCPSAFTGETRKISLDGEGWFEVSHDAAHPFIIDAGKTFIQVLGTSFSVNTNGNGNLKEVILASGKVKVYLEEMPGEPVFLVPGEKAAVSVTGRTILKSANQDDNYLSWKTMRLVFNNTPLNEVAAMLTRTYHVSITISGTGLSECKITATFDRQSLESVLNVLKATLDLQVRNTGAGFELTGHDCSQPR